MATIEKRERKKGTVYRAVVRVNGFPIQRRSFKRLTDARRWAHKTEEDIKSGQFENVVSTARGTTVKDVIERYRAEVLPEKSPSTQRVEGTYLKFWEAELGKHALSFVKPEHISERLRKLAGEGDSRIQLKEGEKPPKPKSRKTIKLYRDTLELLFKHAKRWRLIGSNPVEGVNRIINIRNERVRYLSDEERAALLKACKASANKLLYPIVVFAISTGARKGEILKLTIDDIDLKRGYAVLRDTKNKDTRAVPVVSHLAELLKTHIKDVKTRYADAKTPPAKQWVFPRKDGRAPMDFRKSWENAREAAGIEDFRFHDLRHSTASYLAMNGASELEIAQVLGHRTLQMVKRYSHLSEDHTKDVVERMNDKIF